MPPDLNRLGTAADQKVSGVTGDQHSSLDRVANTPSAMGGVATAWWDNVKTAAGSWSSPAGGAGAGGSGGGGGGAGGGGGGGGGGAGGAGGGGGAVATLRKVQATAGAIMGGVGVMQDMLNVGFANLTAPLAAISPSLPAATITSLYLGVPHAHSHPPSLIPPAPPVPLPSIGSVMLGTCVKVLIAGMPAARCGDIGLAPTCCGFFPFFQIKTGSSNTFIGGNRAARMLDICQVCTQADERKSIDAGKIMGAIGAAARGAQAAIKYGGMAVQVLGIAADAAEAVEADAQDQAAMASAKALAASMAAAQMAADLAAQALTKMMGKDPGIPPASVGAVTLGKPTVLIGGFPMVNIPNPVDLLLGRLARYKTKPQPPKKPGHCGTPACD